MSIKLFVANFPFSMTEIQLLELFSEHVLVKQLNIIKEGIKSLGYGFVHLHDQTAANRAIYALDGKLIDDQKISVRLADSKRV